MAEDFGRNVIFLFLDIRKGKASLDFVIAVIFNFAAYCNRMSTAENLHDRRVGSIVIKAPVSVTPLAAVKKIK